MASSRRLSIGQRPTGILALACLYVFLATPLQAQQIQVTAADPPAAEQGTVNLNVSVKGKGFKKGAAASFLLTGTENPDGIAVNSTAFVSSTELTANITVAETATVSKFDIKVRNSDGRIGKGTELFAVLQKGGGAPQTNVPAISVLEMQNPATSAPLRIHSDGGGAYIGYSLKPSGKQADVLLSVVYTGTGDWVVDTLSARTQPRSVYLDLRDGFSPIGQVELLVPARVLVRCVLEDDPSTSENEGTWADGGLLVMSASLPKKTNCGLRVLFTHDGSPYVLILGPHTTGNSSWVTCTGFSADGSSCTSWQIEAGTYDPVLNPTGNPGILAWLMLRNPPNGAETKVGEYNVSFRFQVTRQ